jgi:hypothetical protein
LLLLLLLLLPGRWIRCRSGDNVARRVENKVTINTQRADELYVLVFKKGEQ